MHLKSLTSSLLKYHNRKIHEIEKHRRRHTNTHYLFHSLCVCVCVCTDRNEITFRFACQLTLFYFLLFFDAIDYKSVFVCFFFTDFTVLMFHFYSHFTEFHNNRQSVFTIFGFIPFYLISERSTTIKREIESAKKYG